MFSVNFCLKTVQFLGNLRKADVSDWIQYILTVNKVQTCRMSYKLLLICKLLSHEDCTVFWKSEEADVLDIGQVWLLVCPRPAKPLFNTSVIGDQDDHLQNSVAWGVEWLMRKVWRSRKPPFEMFPFVFWQDWTLIPAPVSKCPSPRTWLDKSPLKWPNRPRGPTLSYPGVKRGVAKVGFLTFCRHIH